MGLDVGGAVWEEARLVDLKCRLPRVAGPLCWRSWSTLLDFRNTAELTIGVATTEAKELVSFGWCVDWWLLALACLAYNIWDLGFLSTNDGSGGCAWRSGIAVAIPFSRIAAKGGEIFELVPHSAANATIRAAKLAAVRSMTVRSAVMIVRAARRSLEDDASGVEVHERICPTAASDQTASD